MPIEAGMEYRRRSMKLYAIVIVFVVVVLVGFAYWLIKQIMNFSIWDFLTPW